MALGDSIRALKIVSRAKGWDPDQIPGGSSIGDWNQVPKPLEADAVAGGSIPDGTPAQSVPEGYPDSPLSAKVTWTVGGPNDDGNTPIRHTRGADPFPGKPGAR